MHAKDIKVFCIVKGTKNYHKMKKKLVEYRKRYYKMKKTPYYNYKKLFSFIIKYNEAINLLQKAD